MIAHLFHGDRWSHDEFLTNFSLFVNAISTVVSDRSKWSGNVDGVDLATGLPGPMLKMCLEYAKASSGDDSSGKFGIRLDIIIKQLVSPFQSSLSIASIGMYLHRFFNFNTIG